MIMLEDVKAFVERHPYWIGGGVLAIVIIYLVAGSSSSSAAATTAATATTSTTGEDDTVTVAQLQASSAAAATQAQAQLANNQLSAELQSQQYTDATQITLAEIAAGYPITGGSVAPGTPIAVTTPVTTTPVTTSSTYGGCTGTIADYSNPNCNTVVTNGVDSSQTPPATPPPVVGGPGIQPNTLATISTALFGTGVSTASKTAAGVTYFGG
jgi:hypothetical protein